MIVVRTLAVGAPLDDDGGTDHGAIWILFLNGDGTVKGHQKISDTEGGFTGELDDEDNFGAGLALLGDLDGALAVAKRLEAPASTFSRVSAPPPPLMSSRRLLLSSAPSI